jgi:Lrp/AsnC family leucine-responsive transcriptional regulator
MDDHDLRILRILQHDGRATMEAIAARVGLSPASVQRRIKRLRVTGAIEKEIAVVAPEAVDLPVTVIVNVELEREQLDLLEQFKRDMRKLPEVQQCYYVTGATDFVLVVIARNMREYEKFTHRAFFSNPNVRNFLTHVVMDRVKAGLSLPL